MTPESDSKIKKLKLLLNEIITGGILLYGPIIYFDQFLKEAREYNLELNGDYLSYNYLMMFWVPFVILLRFID